MAGSVIGAVVGLLMILIGRREWSARIPFGPYLALARRHLDFFGPECWTPTGTGSRPRRGSSAVHA